MNYYLCYSEKPLALRNSRLTTTTSRLSQHMVDIEDNYRDKQYAESLGNLAKNLESVSRNVGNTLRRSVTFSGKQLNRELKDTIDKRVAEKDNVDLWYTSPVHINRQEYSLSPQHGASSRSRSPHKYSGTLGAALSLQNIPPRQRSYKEEEKYEENGEEDQLSLSFNDSIGLKYFPVTLSASYEMSNLDRKLEQLESKPRPRTAKPYIKTSYDAGSVNSMYLMGTEAPSTCKTSIFFFFLFISPLIRVGLHVYCNNFVHPLVFLPSHLSLIHFCNRFIFLYWRQYLDIWSIAFA